jgi:hypothetical protein
MLRAQFDPIRPVPSVPASPKTSKKRKKLKRDREREHGETLSEREAPESDDSKDDDSPLIDEYA